MDYRHQYYENILKEQKDNYERELRKLERRTHTFDMKFEYLQQQIQIEQDRYDKLANTCAIVKNSVH